MILLFSNKKKYTQHKTIEHQSPADLTEDHCLIAVVTSKKPRAKLRTFKLGTLRYDDNLDKLLTISIFYSSQLILKYDTVWVTWVISQMHLIIVISQEEAWELFRNTH